MKLSNSTLTPEIQTIIIQHVIIIFKIIDSLHSFFPHVLSLLNPAHLQHISIWMSHTSSAQKPEVVSGYYTGQHSSRYTKYKTHSGSWSQESKRNDKDPDSLFPVPGRTEMQFYKHITCFLFWIGKIHSPGSKIKITQYNK